MSKRFAVKLGEIHLVADRPITPEELAQAVAEYEKRVLIGVELLDSEGYLREVLQVEIRLPPSP